MVSSGGEARSGERRLACEVSMANGEDPAGTGAPFVSYLMVEVALPWRREITESRGFPEGLREAVVRARRAGVVDKLTGLMPDPEYSREGHSRVVYLRRPPGALFAAYEKEEYLVPEGEVTLLIEALTAEPEGLARFAGYKQDTSHLRDILVCTHGSRDVCCGRFGCPIYEQLRNDYAAGSEGHLRVWRTSHVGGHRFAPNLLDLPEGRYWCRLRPRDLESLVLRTGPVSDLLPFHRGWAGLSGRFEQITEGEAFAREGWGWAAYRKRGEAFEAGEDRAEVRIEYKSADGSASGSYEATVTASGSVATLQNSGAGPSEYVRQYIVDRLEKIPSSSKES